MRAGLSTIQQTLTPEASSVLNHSIAEAARRNHSQTTPLHVAATLLASPSGFLRQACIRSHPNSSHPLQCRALELCFSVALERLPSSQTLSPGLEPPISNALMAALKRAQAHQRRGCPEQQQQPLLAVKVELEQLIVSILDDPSVSRVMREASFSSPAVKATIEQSLNSSNSLSSPSVSAAGLGLKRNGLYVNPRLLQQGNCEQSGMQRRDEAKRVVEIMMRSKKRNPVLVGDTEPELVMRELLGRIEKREFGDGLLRNVGVVSLGKEFTSDRSKIAAKMMELGGLVESRVGNNGGAGGGGLILDLGDLKWLVEQNVGFGVVGSGQQIVSDMGRIAVAEMGKLLARFGGESGGSVWLIGTATCETYMRCQVYHPTMENDWDLQALPIAARSPLPGMFPRLGGNGILSSSVESLTPLKGFTPAATTLPLRLASENTDLARKTSCCPLCTENYEKEVAKLKEIEKSFSDAKQETRPPLPAWLQTAKPSNGVAKETDPQTTKDQELIWKQKTEELKKKWNDTCYRLHHSSHSLHSITNLHNSNLLGRHPFAPKLQPIRNISTLQMNPTITPNPPERPFTPPGSPVRTDLLLGRPKVPENAAEKTHRERISDSTGCIPSEWQDSFCDQRQRNIVAGSLDTDSFKRLFKGLTEKVRWQSDAASAVATTVFECRSGNGKRRGPGWKGDTWLLFAGPDKVGKKKMALALSDLVFGALPITICLGPRSDESVAGFRGKTALDRIAEAVRRNQFSVVMLEEIDQADILVHGGIKRAIERGRLLDSHGREVGLGSVIFVLTSDWLPDSLSSSPNVEEKLAAVAGCGWQLNLSVVTGKAGKRRAEWLGSDGRITKPRTDTAEALSIDLNLAAEAEEDSAEGSRNSSDLTVERDHSQGLIIKRSTSSLANDLFASVDDAIVFKPVDFSTLRTKITSTVAAKFARIVGEGRAIEIDSDALDRIVAGAWFGRTEFDEWVEKVLVPGFQQLKAGSPVDNDAVFRLVLVLNDHVPVSDRRSRGDFLPSKISVVFDGM